ncbi:MAG: PucR family transcriptional regulator [Solirubrobacteraceae bacterium]
MASATPRTTPLQIVSGAVAGDDLERVARSAAEALGCPVAIIVPVLGEPALWPPGALSPEQLALVHRLANRDAVSEARHLLCVPIEIGREPAGIVVAFQGGAPNSEQRAWLEATAAASAVTALMRDSARELGESRRALLIAFLTEALADPSAFVRQARTLGVELGSGAVGVCGRLRSVDATREGAGELDFRRLLSLESPALLAGLEGDRFVGLIALGGPAPEGRVQPMVEALKREAVELATSSPRRDPAALREALHEAELLLELTACASGHEQTYRLLIGVLLRDPGELLALRSSTIAALIEYDAQHDTELVATLQAFLSHHGSTSETAEAMRLHRHTVGYRLSRVHEVSGLSPYESDGRERLSLGLKAHQILQADRRRAATDPIDPPEGARARA